VYAVLAALVGIVGVVAEGGLSEAAVLRLAAPAEVGRAWADIRTARKQDRSELPLLDGGAHATASQSAEGANAHSPRSFFWLRIAVAAGVVLVLGPFAAPIAQVLNLADDGTLTRWALVGIVATACSGAVSVLLQSAGRFAQLSGLTVFNTALTLLLALLLVFVGQLTLLAALVVLGIGTSLATFVFGVRLLRGNLRPPPRGELRAEGRALLRTGRWLWLAALLAMLAVNLDVLIVNRFSPLEAVGAYALAANLASKANIVNHSLYTVLLPGVARLTNPAAIRRYLKQSLLRSSLVAGALLVSIPLAQPFVLLVYGDQFAPAVPLLQLLLGVVIIDVLATPALLLPLAFGRTRLMAGADGARALTLLLVGAVLVPAYGPAAAIVARFASRLAGALVIIAFMAPFKVQHKEATGVTQSG
jgi:O-antigen/teichoic acid export membrane protein